MEERKSERSTEKSESRTSERKAERGSEKKNDRVGERRNERGSDRSSDRPNDRQSDRNDRKSDREYDRKYTDPYNDYLSWWFKSRPRSRPEFSLFVGDLSEDVDNYILYDAFTKRYRSCRAAKVVYDNSGKHKGYGFVRFSEEHDLQRAVKEMQHMTGIGRNPVRVGPALHKNRMSSLDAPGTVNYRDPYYSHYSQHHPPYNSYYNSWQGYSDQYYQYPYSQPDYTAHTQNYYDTAAEDEMESLEDPCLEIDIEKMNKEFIEQSEEFYTALESSRWHPLDSATSQITSVTS